MKKKSSSAATTPVAVALRSADDLSWPNQGFVPSSKLGDVALPIIRGIHAPSLPTEEALLANPPTPNTQPLDKPETAALTALAAAIGPEQAVPDRPTAELLDLVVNCQTWAKEANVVQWQTHLALLVCRGNVSTVHWLMQLGIHWHGVAFMLRVWLPLSVCDLWPQRSLNRAALMFLLWDRHEQLHALLRHAIALTDDAGHAAALASVEAWRSSSTLPPMSTHLSAYLCPGHTPWVDEHFKRLFEYHGAKDARHRMIWAGATCTMTLAQMKQFLHTFPPQYPDAETASQREFAAAETAYYGGYLSNLSKVDFTAMTDEDLQGLWMVLPWLVHLHGADAVVPFLEPLFGLRYRNKKTLQKVVAWVVALEGKAQIDLLLLHRNAEPGLQSALNKLNKRCPEAVLYASIQQWSKKRKNKELGEWLQTCAQHKPAAYQTVAPLIQPALRDALAASFNLIFIPPVAPASVAASAALVDASPPAPAASPTAPSSMPSWLAQPPWLNRPSASRRKKTTLKVALLPITSELAWESWLSPVKDLLKEPTAAPDAPVPAESAPVASVVFDALRSSKKMQQVAQRWMQNCPRTAANVALHQAACATSKPLQDDGLYALQWLCTNGHSALIDDVAQAYGPEMVAFWVEVQAADPLLDLPTRIPDTPAFFVPSQCTPPQLRDGGGALPVSVIAHIGTMLVMSKTFERPYAGVLKLKEVCTPSSLAALAWDVFVQWEKANHPAKDAWAFWVLGWWGDDETVRRLVPHLKDWPRQNRNARAVQGFDVLEAIGSDLALMHLDIMATKLEHIALRDHAYAKIRAISDKRHLTPFELSDRIVPSLGLDERGGLRLDFGPRHFLIGFDETLQPFVRDAQGKPLKILPKPNTKDDAEKAQAATERFKALKKDVRTIAPVQIRRLEQAMALQRRWAVADFEQFYVNHPLMRFLAMRLVWGVYQDGALVQAFRIAEDGSLADGADHTYVLARDAVVGIAHVLEMPPDIKGQFGQLMADYEIVQPFPQMSRETFALTAEEANGYTLTRFAQKKVHNNDVRALLNQGWERHPSENYGSDEKLLFKQVSLTATAELTIDPPMNFYHLIDDPSQTVKSICLRSNNGRQWSALSPVAASEVLRDFEMMPAYRHR